IPLQASVEGVGIARQVEWSRRRQPVLRGRLRERRPAGRDPALPILRGGEVRRAARLVEPTAVRAEPDLADVGDEDVVGTSRAPPASASAAPRRGAGGPRGSILLSLFTASPPARMGRSA